MDKHSHIFEWKQYGHWKHYARKARLSAYVIWKNINEITLDPILKELGYEYGDAMHAMRLAFSRESSIALELIVKAVIAKQLEGDEADPSTKKGRVELSHDLPKLWEIAKLPELSKLDQTRLLMVKSILMWSGRYATPTSEKAWVGEMEEFKKLDEEKTNKLVFREPTVIEWSDFDRIYKVAETVILR